MEPGPAERERVWVRVQAALPTDWRVGPATYNPGRGRWTVSSWSPVRGRRRPPEHTLTGEAVDEVGAVTDLAMALEERARSKRVDQLDRRGRLAYVAGAEEESRRLGRPLTDEELDRVLRRFPADPGR
jgi:hypothetical protein